MQAFAALLEALVYAPQRNAKLRIIESWLAGSADPDRGLGLAALTGELVLPHVRGGMIRALVESRVDPLLFGLSRDYVGDLAETAALIWPAGGGTSSPRAPSLAEVVAALTAASRDEAPALVAGWLDVFDASGRFALLKLATGALRVGVSARLAKTAVASWGGVPLADIEEVWHGLAPPYLPLFAWLEGRTPPPAPGDVAVFRPMMLAQPLDEGELGGIAAADFAAEWKWDGIRVQLAGRGAPGAAAGAVFSRGGDEISGAFPEISGALCFSAVLDGELLVVRDAVVGPFNDLQQRLGRKGPSRGLMRQHPAHVRLYDILREDGEDLRTLPFQARRARLEAWFARMSPARMDVSPLLPFEDWADLAALRADARDAGREGLMLKRRDSIYVAGRPKGLWFKWKRDPLTVDCVLMYAQRGSGKRSSYYSDYTFGCWRTGDQGAELVPVGKAYSGFTDAELVELDKWVRGHTVERFGPVRAVAPGLVLEVAFDALQPSQRHRSGIAMRFPRIRRIRWDKPAEQADTLENLRVLLPPHLD
ncbi:MAG: cisplatin damage response ATP-dependent DNA ligase [Rhodospirillales bacterium]|nr:cisplatin damage response ATP-dependent DNA ligase [Rhodospirillales bacterium]